MEDIDFARSLARDEPFPGLVWAYAMEPGERPRPVDGADLASVLAGQTGFVWLHLNRSNLRCQEWIRRAAPFPDSARELVLDEDDHLSLVAEEGTLVGVFPDFRREFDHGTKDIARLRFALGPRVLLTCRRHALHAAEAVRRQISEGRTFDDASEILEAIFETFVAEVLAVARDLSDTLEKIEDRVVEDTVAEGDVRLGPTRRLALKLSRQLGALRLHSSAFVASDERSVSDEIFAMVERVSLRLEGASRDIEAIQERARILQEEFSAKLADQANRQLYALSAMTALFLPATLVTGLFGMNVQGLPLANSPVGFWLAFLTGCAGSAAVYVILKRLGVMK